MIDVPVLVKDALREGTYRKNYRFNVLNDDGTIDFTIDNNNLVKESVFIDERMNSGDKIKFGLCEGASLEFQYFGKPNINGRTLNAFLDAYYVNASGNLTSYAIPMGIFTVDKISRQASTGIMKVTAYNKLMSDYLDAKANELLIDAYNNQDSYSPSTIEKLLDITLADYKIDTHTSISTMAYNDITANISSLVGTSEQINLAVYRGDGQGSEGYYLHGICPYIRIRFTTESHMYKIAKFSDGYINTRVMELAGAPYGLYDEYKLVSTDISFYSWLSSPGTNTAEIRGGIYKYNYTDANNTTHDAVGFLCNSDEYIPTSYYWDINSKTTPYGSIYYFGFYCPVYWVLDQSPTYDWSAISQSTHRTIRSIVDEITNYYASIDNFDVWKQKTSVASNMSVGSEIEDWPEVTLRELQSAIYELSCQYGQLDRKTDEFSGVELNNSRLYPQDTLYPATSLYPGGAAISGSKSMYQKLWADEGNIHKWKYLIITYKGLDGQGNEVDKTLQRTINADGTDNYNMSDNWLFRNLVWAAEDVGDYADAMVAKMQDMTWFPFEMWAAGLPYLETGDEIEIPLGEDTYTSYILQRTLKGIQNLQDTYINGTLDIF